MKKLLTLITFFLVSYACLAQEKRAVKDENGKVWNYGVSSLNSKIPIFLEPDENTKSISPFNYIPNDPLGTVVFLEGATTVDVTTRIHKDSLNYYRYSVIENDSTVIVSNKLLTKVDFVWNNRSSYPGYLTMNFDVNNTAGKKVTLKVYCTADPNKVTTLIIYNKPIKTAELIERSLYAITEGEKIMYNNFTTTVINNGTVVTDNKKNIGIGVSIKKTDLDFIYKVYLLHTDKDSSRIVFQSNYWSYNTINGVPTTVIERNFFRQAGDYDIVVAPGNPSLKELKSGMANAIKVSFKVVPAPIVFSTPELILAVFTIVLILVGIVAVIIYLMRRKNKAKLMVANLRADAAGSELNMVRAQLNPHFVFNALSGIQSLINKNDIENANNYLNKFAGLTRHILDDSPMVSISDEVKLLSDYLAMERLRFVFKYEVTVDGDVNENVEIPAMLVQPFVENAVKHGIMPLKGEGDINIRFTKHGDDLKITVTDNGKGFDAGKSYTGFGLKLSKKRIDLLNQTYTECPIMLDITATGSQTSVIILLTQWL